VRVSIIRRSEALGYTLPVPNYDIYAMPLRTLVADIMVALAGHVAVKIFLGEYWTGAYSDFQKVRRQILHLASLGYFGPPIADPNAIATDFKSDTPYARFWEQTEENVERLLRQHAAEIEAVAQALLDRGDLTGGECLDIMARAAAQPSLAPQVAGEGLPRAAD